MNNGFTLGSVVKPGEVSVSFITKLEQLGADSRFVERLKQQQLLEVETLDAWYRVNDRMRRKRG